MLIFILTFWISDKILESSGVISAAESAQWLKILEYFC